MAYDKGILERFNNSHEEAKAALESLLVHVQTAYCHFSLGSQLIIEKVEDFRYIDKELSVCDLSTLPGSDTESHIGNANLMVYMVSTNKGANWCNGAVGFANMAVACSENRKTALSTNLFLGNEGLCGDAWVRNFFFPPIFHSLKYF